MARIILSIVLLFFLCSCDFIIEEPLIHQLEEGFVERVVDGDTLLLDTGEKVRFVGINTPEKWEYYYKDATYALANLVENQTVYLLRDVTDTDKYGRILRYVYLEDDTLVNAVMVEEGYAKAYYYPPDTLYYESFSVLEEEAKSKAIGIWNATAKSASGESGFGKDCNFVASKSGEVYYDVSCKYANRILVKNRVCFGTVDEAVDAGYRETKKC